MNQKTLRPELVPHVAAWLRAMGDETRIRIVLELQGAGGELPVGEIVRRLSISQSTASKHLARLAAVGIVQSRRAGPSVLYRVADAGLGEVCECVCGHVRRAHERSWGMMQEFHAD